MAKTILNSSKKKKSKKPRISINSIRENRGKDLSPSWVGASEWTSIEFIKNWHDASRYYTNEYNAKDNKAAVIKWMISVGCPQNDIDSFKHTTDWRCSSTMGTIASCLLKGMPDQHINFNNNSNIKQWLLSKITTVITDELSDNNIESISDNSKVKIVPNNSPNKDEKIRDVSLSMTDEIDEAIDLWVKKPNEFDPSKYIIINILKGNDAKAPHAKIIKDVYENELIEFTKLTQSSVNADLKEGYSSKSKKHIKNIIAFYKNIESACNIIISEDIPIKKERVKKAIPKEKLIEKLKYLLVFEPLGLTSVNPIDIIGGKELWIYNVVTKKIGKYISNNDTGLGIKGSLIIGFDPNLSVQKTIKQPEIKLKEFKSLGKIALKTFIDGIPTTETKMTGKITEDIILLKLASG